MRINAFTLIELIVAILLLGIMFSLALTSFKPKKVTKIPNIKDLPLYLKKLDIKTDGVFLIYGKNCSKEKLLSSRDISQNDIFLPFDKSFKIFGMNSLGAIKEFNYDDMIIDGVERHICFKLHLKKGKFVDKIIVKIASKYFLFIPFFQTIKTFNSLFDAQKAFLQSDLYPKSADDYYKK